MTGTDKLIAATPDHTSKPLWIWTKGILLPLLLAFTGIGLAYVPGFAEAGPLACAIVIAVGYRQVFGYPEELRPGIQFVGKKLLRVAIVLFGLKLNVAVIFDQGLGLLLRDAAVIGFSIGVMMIISRWLQADRGLSLLLGIGTGVCGAAAIAAVSPILKAKREETAMAIGLIALVGTVFAVGYTLLRPYLGLSAEAYGMWAGLSLHEIAHVALAGAPAGQDGLAMALLAKLGRVMLLVPLCFILMWWMRRREGADSGSKVDFPWFLLGFIAMSLFGSFVLGNLIVIPSVVLDHVSVVTSFLLTMAMAAMGLEVNLRDLRTKAMRPLVAMVMTSVLLTGLTYWMV
ncbi:YeiH family protein [Brevibacillus dissolubilis]|uniref:YeiH family protein n=1 Tax=Brevibacillus dissolubilis TaxID=1844116 RepID=UPI003F65627B